MNCSFWSLNLHFFYKERMRTLSIYIPPLSHTRAVFWFIFVNYTHVITILCVYKCVTGNCTFWLLFTTLIFILICCRAATNRVLFWIFKLRSEFISPPPPTHPSTPRSLCALFKIWPASLTNGAPLCFLSASQDRPLHWLPWEQISPRRN